MEPATVIPASLPSQLLSVQSSPLHPIHDTRPGPLTVLGTTALNHLLPYLALGFVPQPTRGDHLLCALFALTGSLRAARNLNSATGLPLPEADHITLQNLLDILYGERSRFVDERGSIQTPSSIQGKDKHMGLLTQDFSFEASEVAKGALPKGARGELLIDVKSSPHPGYLLASNATGETGLIPKEFLTCRRMLLGKDYLFAVEKHLQNTQAGLDAATLNELRKTFLHVQELSEVQIWLILQVVNAKLGTHFGLGVIKSGYRGSWVKKQWVRDWEAEIESANSFDDDGGAGIVFPWKEECHDWNREDITESYLSVNPCMEQTKLGEDNGPVVWIHNDGFDDSCLQQCGIEEGVAHWESLGPADCEKGRRFVDGWEVEVLLKGAVEEGKEVFRVKGDCGMADVEEEGVKKGWGIKMGSFVYRGRSPIDQGGVSEKLDGEERFIWVRSCDGECEGWIGAQFLEKVARKWNGLSASSAVPVIETPTPASAPIVEPSLLEPDVETPISPPHSSSPKPAVEKGTVIETPPRRPTTTLVLDEERLSLHLPSQLLVKPTITTNNAPPTQEAATNSLLPTHLTIYLTTKSHPSIPAGSLLLRLTPSSPSSKNHPTMVTASSAHQTFPPRNMSLVASPFGLPSFLPLQHATSSKTSTSFPLCTLRGGKEGGEVVLNLGRKGEGKTGPFLVRTLGGRYLEVRPCDFEMGKRKGEGWFGLRVEKGWVEGLIAGVRPGVGDMVEVFSRGKEEKGRKRKVDIAGLREGRGDGEGKERKKRKVAAVKRR